MDKENGNAWKRKQEAWWQFLLHNEDTLTNRTNFFLVAHSFFAAAAATLIDSRLDYELNFVALKLIVWGGIIISIFWLLLGIKMYIRQGAVKTQAVDKFFPEYKNLLETNDFPINSN